ncbi:hypothetical protein FHL15_001920 [Xylaria flabelliformis]|uniref:Uncharacterized protein n=1 Tax=Xylaria flabelliformis TaxID=2512241 RepID=A0A553IA94_9PEZI|nr:hypothetical protein FHL15_001920 [Xylaria flabelliformis]
MLPKCHRCEAGGNMFIPNIVGKGPTNLSQNSSAMQYMTRQIRITEPPIQALDYAAPVSLTPGTKPKILVAYAVEAPS